MKQKDYTNIITGQERQDFSKEAAYFRSLTKYGKQQFILSLNETELIALYQTPELFLQDYQLPPHGYWRYFYLQGGRGSGKTFASTAWLYAKVIRGAQECILVAPDFATFVKEIKPVFEGHFLPEQMPKYNHQHNLYECKNGCVVKVYTSDQQIRGANAEYAVCEEVAKWCDGIPEKVEEAFNTFDLAVRSYNAKPCPQIFISSTPKRWKFFRDLEYNCATNKLYKTNKATTDDNIYLAGSAKEAYHNRYDGSVFGSQELRAEINWVTEGALWSQELIHSLRVGDLPSKPVRTVIGFDPAVSTEGDESGIVVASLCEDKHAYIRLDSSGKYPPAQWAKMINKLYSEYEVSKVVVEKNQGGNVLEYTLRSVNKNMSIQPVVATKSKIVRAEHISALYNQGRCHHVGEFKKLEEQMTTFTTDSKKSPDRLDALVWALTELFFPAKPIGAFDSFRNLPKYY